MTIDPKLFEGHTGGISDSRLEANRVAHTIASSLDQAGAPGNWRGCSSAHCERSEECRSQHACSGRNRALIADQVGPVIAAAFQQNTTLLARVAALEGENARLREAAEPFALVAEHDIGDDESDADRFRPMFHHRAPLLTVGDLRRARAALGRAS